MGSIRVYETEEDPILNFVPRLSPKIESGVWNGIVLDIRAKNNAGYKRALQLIGEPRLPCTCACSIQILCTH